MKRTVKTLWSGLCGLFTAAVVLLTLLLAGARLGGLQLYTVVSGSMEPDYPVGSLLYVAPVDPQTLQTGDVITYALDSQTVVTHRIIALIPGTPTQFQTKGDANAVADALPVSQGSILGTPILCIPHLGYVSAFLQTPAGIFLAVFLGILLLLLCFLPDLLAPTTPRHRRRKVNIPCDPENKS